MDTDLEDFVYLNLAFADETDSPVSESENRRIESNTDIIETHNVGVVNDLYTSDSHVRKGVTHAKPDSSQRTTTNIQYKDFNSLTVDVKIQAKTDICTEWKISSFEKVEKERSGGVTQHAASDHCRVENLIGTFPTFEHVAVTNGDWEQSARGSDNLRHTNVETGSFSNDKNGTIRQFCSDKNFRAKAIRTFFVFLNCTSFGWTFGITGPTLPDLQLISGANLQLASWLFTAFNIGYMVGCATSGFVHRKFHPDSLLFLYTTGHAVAVGALPWTPSIYVMIVLRGIQGYCCGGQDIEISSMIFSVWHSEGGPLFQMTHFLFGFGGILSPLVAEPFMIKHSSYALYEYNITSDFPNNSINATLCNVEDGDTNLSLTSKSAETITCNVVKETNIQLAYLISAFFVFSTAAPFLSYYFTSKRKGQEQKRQVSEIKKQVPGKVQIFVIVLLCFVSALGTGLVESFPAFLATFGLLQLDWTQTTGSMLTALYFAMYATGNFLGVFLLKCISSRSFVYLIYVTSFGSTLLLYIVVRLELSTLQAPTVAAIGLTTSAIIPTIFTWTEEAVAPISGLISSGFLFSGSVGMMVNPILLGFLIESVTPMWFIYLSILEALCCLSILIVATLTIRRFLSPVQNEVQI